MEKLDEIMKKKLTPVNIDNNDSKDTIHSNDINGNNGASNVRGKYALDRTKFTPNTPATVLAEEIATKFDDIENYACYLSVVNRIGTSDAMRLFSSTLSDIEEKKDSKYPVRSEAKYFMYKYRRKKY